MTFSVSERGSTVQVEGRSREEVETALRLLDSAQREQRAHVEAFATTLLTAMVSSGMDIAPQASLAQAKRLAALRADLLASGAFTHAAVAEVRGMAKESSARTWVT